MRISDLSSDVCSSVLLGAAEQLGVRGDDLDLRIDASRSGRVSDTRYVLSDLAAGACLENMIIHARSLGYAADVQTFPRPDDELWAARIHWHRSEEHTSELQSLMRISYAVFCLKQKNKITHKHNTMNIT